MTACCTCEGGGRAGGRVRGAALSMRCLTLPPVPDAMRPPTLPHACRLCGHCANCQEAREHKKQGAQTML